MSKATPTPVTDDRAGQAFEFSHDLEVVNADLCRDFEADAIDLEALLRRILPEWVFTEDIEGPDGGVIGEIGTGEAREALALLADIEQRRVTGKNRPRA